MAHRFEDWTKRNIFLTTLIFAALLLSSLVTISSAVGDLRTWYESRFEWKDAEYAKLASLHAGYSFATFKDKLGAPLFVAPVPHTQFTENSFKGRGYWVDVVVDKAGTALSYAVTSCQEDFRPAFSFADGDSTAHVTLNRSTMTRVADGAELKVFMSGATANSYAFNLVPGSNPTNYKYYAWGLNDSCKWKSTEGEDVSDAWLSWQDRHLSNDPYVEPDGLDASVRALMRKSIVNTYMETAPMVPDSKVYPRQIGVDRILIRTA